MISFHFNLQNSWTNTFKNLWCRSFKTPFNHKFVELEVYKFCSIASFNFAWTVRQSHAGIDLELGLFGYGFHFNFYDNRHWNTETNQWYIYNTETGTH